MENYDRRFRDKNPFDRPEEYEGYGIIEGVKPQLFASKGGVSPERSQLRPPSGGGMLSGSGGSSAPPEGEGGSLLDNPIVKKIIGKGKDALKDYLDTLGQDKSIIPDESGFGGLDPFSEDNWNVNDTTGEFEWGGHEAYDPADFSFGDDGTITYNFENPAFDPDNYKGTLLDPGNLFGETDMEWAARMGAMNSGSLIGNSVSADLASIGDEIVSLNAGTGIMDKLGGAAGIGTMGYGAYKALSETHGVDKTKAVVNNFVPGMLATVVGGPAGAIAGAMYGGLGAMQAIGANRKKVSRDYYDPYYGYETEGGNRFTIGRISSDSQDQTMTGDWGGVASNLGDDSRSRAFLQDSVGNTYDVPLEDIFDKGLEDPASIADRQAQAEREYYGLSGETAGDYQEQNSQWLANAYTPEYINEKVDAWLKSHPDAQPLQQGVFKDTPVYYNGKNPLVVSSVQNPFETGYFGDYAGQYETPVDPHDTEYYSI